MLPCFIDTARDYPGSAFGKGPDTHQGCRAVAGPVAVADEMQILHRGFAATHEVAEWAEDRTETSAPDQMVVVELAQTIEDGGSAERAGIAELTEMRKRDNVPEVRAGIATENPAAPTSLVPAVEQLRRVGVNLSQALRKGAAVNDSLLHEVMVAVDEVRASLGDRTRT